MSVPVATAGVGSSLPVFSQRIANGFDTVHNCGRCGLLRRVLLNVGIGPAPTAIIDGANLVTLINGRKAGQSSSTVQPHLWAASSWG